MISSVYTLHQARPGRSYWSRAAADSGEPEPALATGNALCCRIPGDRPRAARIEARPLGQVIWLQLSWGGLTSGALLAGVYRADTKDGVVGWRRYLMNGLMDGLIAGYLVETTVSCTPID